MLDAPAVLMKPKRDYYFFVLFFWSEKFQLPPSSLLSGLNGRINQHYQRCSTSDAV